MRRKRHVYLFSFVVNLLSLNIQAQQRIGRAIYDHVSNVHLENHDLDKLVSDLTDPYPEDEVKKAESIYVWIKLNLAYDFIKFSGMHGAEGVDTTINVDQFLQDSMGVAEDFALLAKEMFQRASIPCEIITGWAKGGVEETVGYINNNTHAWNAIRLKNKWQLLDCSWASLGILAQDSSDFYFLPPPDQLIYSHYPRDSKWKLTDVPVTLNIFKQLPYVKPLIFSFIEGPLPKQGHIRTYDKYLYIDSFLHPDSSIEYSLQDKKSGMVTTQYLQFVKINGKKKYKITIPYPGDWLLKIGTYLPHPDKLRWYHEFVTFFINYKK